MGAFLFFFVDNSIEISNIRFTPKDFDATADQIKLLILKNLPNY
tara:strand:+ start:581 stop:712 length:132 start_codon:yes stop_codon:yes gene_type:complete